MKRYYKILAFSLLGFTMNSCTEDSILDTSPINALSPEAAFSTPSLVEASLNGVYNAAQIGQYNATTPNGGRGYVWGAAFVQQGDCRGEDVVNTATFYDLTYSATYDPGTANNVYYWVDGYRLINRCNVMIEGVQGAVAKGIITAAVGNDYIGQVKFLRAITHFELLTYFARPYNFTAGATHPGIPYRTVGVDTQAEIEAESTIGRSTVAECYDKIIADLNDAEALITQTATKSKATKNAAIAFKTRVYLHKRDWNNVITEGNKITGSYTLTSEPNGPFANNLTNSESIFSIAHSSTLNPGVNAGLASQYKTRRLVCISPIIWRDASWLSDDKRRQEGVMVETVGGIKYTNKYKDGSTYTDAAPVIRYAEVLLNMAEAHARKAAPDVTTSLNLLNSVRNRSLANPGTQAYTAASFATATDLVGAILKERRIEFLMEGRRWSDIQRLQNDDLFPINGIPAKITSASNPPASAFTLGTPYSGPYGVPAIPSTDKRILWPIPQIVTNLNPTLAGQQNPGW